MSATEGMKRSSLLEGHRFDRDDFRDFHADDAFDALLERHLRHGASTASAHELKSDDAVSRNLNDLGVAAVGVKRRANAFERRFNALAHAVKIRDFRSFFG